MATETAAPVSSVGDENRIVNRVVQVVRTGKRIVVPEDISIAEAIASLRRYQAQEEEVVTVSETFHAFPPDGAHALYLALNEMFGWVSLMETPGLWEDNPPAMIHVESGPGQTIQVPWSRMTVPGLEGWLHPMAEANEDGRLEFRLHAQVKRRCERMVKEIGVLIRKYLASDSIYRGKAFRIHFRDDNGDMIPMPSPVFMRLDHVNPDELILPKMADSAVRTSIFTPIQRTEDCRRQGIPLKRGILLAGPFGVGKTLTASVTAKVAQENGWTFIYCEDAAELAEAIRLAQNYSPAVVFAEDIDRVVHSRDMAVEDLLNVIDGVDAKANELLIILTTNTVSEIHQGMLRPGRLDAVIALEPADEQAAERLMRLYGRGLVDARPLLNSRRELAGNIPAVIRECVERSKLSAIRLSRPGEELVITDEALYEAAVTMKTQRDLLEPKKVDSRSDIEKGAGILAEALRPVPDGKGRTHPVVETEERRPLAQPSMVP